MGSGIMRRFLCCSAGGAGVGGAEPGRGRIQRHRPAAAQRRPPDSTGDPRSGARCPGAVPGEGSLPWGCARRGSPSPGAVPRRGSVPSRAFHPRPPQPGEGRPRRGHQLETPIPAGLALGIFQDSLFFSRKLLARRRFRCGPGGAGKEPLYKPLPRSPC